MNRRNEQILKVAQDYVSGVTLSSPSNVIHFVAGAKWADKNPINLWHDASEEPQGDNWEILCVDNFDLFWLMSKYSWLYSKWDEYVEIESVKMWAYIDDLLPKQFGNSKQVKGDKK